MIVSNLLKVATCHKSLEVRHLYPLSWMMVDSVTSEIGTSTTIQGFGDIDCDELHDDRCVLSHIKFQMWMVHVDSLLKDQSVVESRLAL